MQDLVTFADIKDGPAGQHSLHGVAEDVPIVGAVKVVHYQESSAMQIVPHAHDFCIRQIPIRHLRCIDPRILVKDTVVGKRKVPLLTDIDAGQASDTLREMDVRLPGPILSPPSTAEPPTG